MVSPIRVICVDVWGIGWWLVLAHNIGLFSHHIPDWRNSWAVLSLVLNRLENEAWLVGQWRFSYNSHLMLISHF